LIQTFKFEACDIKYAIHVQYFKISGLSSMDDSDLSEEKLCWNQDSVPLYPSHPKVLCRATKQNEFKNSNLSSYAATEKMYSALTESLKQITVVDEGEDRSFLLSLVKEVKSDPPPPKGN
jgi:hypothetical protein